MPRASRPTISRLHSARGDPRPRFRPWRRCTAADDLLNTCSIPSRPWRLKWTSPSRSLRAPCPFRKLSMTAFLTLDSISLSTPDGRPLFDGLTLALGRERTGLVGRNGCGKSTLLRLLAGEIEPAGGSVQRAGSIGMLAQLTDDSVTVAEALGVADDLARLRRLERGEGSLRGRSRCRLDIGKPTGRGADGDRPARCAAGSAARFARAAANEPALRWLGC